MVWILVSAIRRVTLAEGVWVGPSNICQDKSLELSKPHLLLSQTGIMITQGSWVFVELEGDNEYSMLSSLLGHGKPTRVASIVLKDKCMNKERVGAMDSTEEINY